MRDSTEETTSSSNPRIQPTEITGLQGAMVKRFSRKMLGEVPEPLGVYWHNQRVLKDVHRHQRQDAQVGRLRRESQVVRPHGGRRDGGLQLLS